MFSRLSCALGASILALSLFNAGYASTAPQRASKDPAATTCQVNEGNSTSIIGIPGAGDVAGGASAIGGTYTHYAGVAAGNNNQTCSDDTSIFADINKVVELGDRKEDATDNSIVIRGSGNYADAFDESPSGADVSNVIDGGGPIGAFTNSAVASGYSSSATRQGAGVPGASKNIAAVTDTFASGTDAAFVERAGSYVFSDAASGAKQIVASDANVFLVRASGGVAFYSNSGLTAGVELHSGSGAWSNLSDRNAKRDLVALDPQSILAKVAALPVDEWSYRTEGEVRHVGPMAQDFYAAFKVGEDSRHITTIDEGGVALAAIKALYADKVSLADAVKHKDRELSALRRAVDRLAARDARLEADMALLEGKERVAQK